MPDGWVRRRAEDSTYIASVLKILEVSNMEIKKIAVLGAGVMGHGIAQVCAQAGYEVNLRDI